MALIGPTPQSPGTPMILWSFDPDPFGNGTPRNPTGPVGFNLRFPGQFADGETGLNYNYFRDYDPTTGRYIESDPIGLGGGINTYAYAGGNPVLRSDPRGEFWPALLAFGFAMLAAESANAPGPCDAIAPSRPATPYIAGLLAGSVGRGAEALLARLAAESAGAVGRGLGQYGGILSSSTNSAGGELWTSAGEISQNDFAGIVNGGLMKGGDVNILSGVHGLASGEMVADLSLYNADVATFGRMPGVNIYNIPEMTAGEISKVLNSPGTTIGGFCNSGACRAPFR
jgi:RHS repeat-associated protein